MVRGTRRLRTHGPRGSASNRVGLPYPAANAICSPRTMDIGTSLLVVTQIASVITNAVVMAHAMERAQRGDSCGGFSPHSTSQSLRMAAASAPTVAIDSRRSSDVVSSATAC